MKNRFSFFLLFFGLLIIQTHAQTPSAGKTVGPEKGALVIVGGGNMPPEIWGRFIELAGGPTANIVVIPTAGDDSSIVSGGARDRNRLLDLGVKTVTVLHTRDPKEANQAAFVEPLRKATGVWFVGGRHWRLADSYLNTLAHKELNALLNRGGVIGGTSAGATILGSFMVRGDTKGNTIMVGDHTQGLDFIHNVTIDQHILRRNRQFDLTEVIKARPELLGIGIDEGTAIVVQKNSFDVIGNSYVAIHDAEHIAGKSKLPAGQYSNIGSFYFLGRGQKFDLLARKPLALGPQRPNEPAK
jgi:cyanophycinase